MDKAEQLRAEEEAKVWLEKLNSETEPLLTTGDAVFLAWLSASPLHQAAYIKLKAEYLSRQGDIHSLPRLHKGKSWLTLGWSLVLVGCVIAAFWGISQYSEEEYVPAVAFRTVVGQQSTYTLVDGSTMVLNTDSHVRVTMSKGLRQVTLEGGEAVISVAQDPERPFILASDTGAVQAELADTVFAVNRSAQDLLVTVQRGQVTVGQMKEQGRFRGVKTLLQNQQITVRHAISGYAAKDVDADAAVAWQQRQLIYQGVTLDRAVADINRYYSTQIYLAEPALYKLELTAVIPLGEQDAVVAGLTQALDISAEFQLRPPAVILHLKP